MKKMICAFVVLAASCISTKLHAEGTGVAYYFSSSQGDDSRTAGQARNPATPWRTINKLNSVMSSFAAGDAILFKRGDVFNGTIKVMRSGTSTTMPMIFSAYGTGPNPKISGFTTLSAWTPVKSGIYSTPLTMGATNIVLLNGVVQGMGRYPNTGYLNYESHYEYVSGTNDYRTITDNQLAASPSWTGGEVVIRKRRWILDREKIVAHNGTTIQYAPTAQYYGNVGAYNPTDRYGYFIQNHLSTLDTPGEWYFDATAGVFYMHFGSLAPSTQVVQVGTIDFNMTIASKSYIAVRDLDFEGSNKAGINMSSAYCVNITNCNFNNHERNGIYGTDLNTVNVDGGTVNNTLNNGVQFETNATNCRVAGMAMTNIGMIAGLGGCGDGTSQGIHVSGTGNLISKNRLVNIGYNGIAFFGNNVTVENNFVQAFCCVKDDGGGIYTYTGGVGGAINRKISGNIILDGYGALAGAEGDVWEQVPKAAGIYLDQESEGIEISGNSVAHGPWGGIFLHQSRNIQILNNIVYDYQYQLHFLYGTNTCRNVTRQGNQFVARQSWQYSVYNHSYYNESESLTGTSNFNIITKPISETTSLHLEIDAIHNYVWSLGQWQQYSGQDTASRSAPLKVTDINAFRFEYNDTSSTKIISLDGAYVGTDGTSYSSQLTLAPFTSIVLLKGSTTSSTSTTQSGPIATSGQKPPTNGMIMWLKADSINLGAGAAVGMWPDSSGNGKNASNSISTNQPVFVQNVQNGLPSVRFDGQRFLRLPGGFNNFSAGLSAFTVVRAQATPTESFPGIFWCNNTVDENSAPNNGTETRIYPRWERVDQFGILEDYESQNWSYETWNTAPIVPVPASPARLAAGSGSAIDNVDGFKYNVTHLNAVLQRAGTPGGYSPLTRTFLDSNYAAAASSSSGILIPNNTYKNYCYIGCREETGSRFIGDMHEIVLYNRELTETERIAVQKYLSAKWGLSAPFAENDTFTSTPGTALTCNVLVNDFFGKSIQLNASQPSAGGTVSVLSDGTIRFVPATNFSGTVSFTYTIQDTNTKLVSPPATVVITVSNTMTRSMAALPTGTGEHLPIILSGPTVDALPAIAGVPAAFNVVTDPADANVSWDFGDGSSGNGLKVTHAFTSPGNFTITINITDQLNNSVTSTFEIIVIAPDQPQPVDNIESPLLQITGLKIKLNFANPGNDSIVATGRIPMTDLNLDGQIIVLNIGGISREFTLNAKGQAGNGTASLKILRSKRSQMAKFSAKICKDAFENELADEGLENANVSSAEVSLSVSLDVGGTTYQAIRKQSYTAKAGRSGATNDK